MQFKDSRRLSTASNRESGHCHCLPSSLKLCEQPNRAQQQRAAAEPPRRGTGPAAGTGAVCRQRNCVCGPKSPRCPLWYHAHTAEARSRLALCPRAPGTAVPSVHWNPARSSFSPQRGWEAAGQDLPAQHPCDQTSSGSSSSKPLPVRHLRCSTLRPFSVPEHHVPSVPWQCRTYLMISRFS